MMLSPESLEAAMLLCFSAGWYWSIWKMLRVRAAIGKSPHFVMLVSTGYGLGVAAKLLAWQATGTLHPIIWLYAWNMCVTAADLLLVLHFSRGGRPERAGSARSSQPILNAVTRSGS